MKNKIITIIVLCILICSGLVYYFSIDKSEENKIEETIEVVQDEKDTVEYKKYIELNEKYKALNDDYVGIVSFESGLLEYPFVVTRKALEDYKIYNNYAKVVTDLESGCESGICTLNDVYLRTNFEDNSYNLGGSIFMDYRNSLNDQNIIIYGHHFDENADPSKTKFFTSLELLLDKENYKDNKYVKLYLENEVRRYELFAVYKFEITSNDDYENLQYFRTEYDYDYYGNKDEGYYKSYIDQVNKVKEYDTDISLTTDDKTLTLQTCIGTSGKYIQIVLLKEIEVLPYN